MSLICFGCAGTGTIHGDQGSEICRVCTPAVPPSMPKPSNVRSIWDNGGSTQDRYTVVLDLPVGSLFECLGLDDQPTRPLGFSQFSICEEGPCLGERINWLALPEHLQKHIAARVSE
ncbi:hypothetical protein SAMN03159338_1512 [Sphingomonas sp. NFR04]|uniref:hypothetical protein n=1 Tax=Sphingomonas sp. NFR04 TaxID=1566283 RepID=UPI0008DEBDE5|nr:hypothetical protein [Sphingomonas sp. NFR04]SFJ48067.1 hypothetical protein SAMN03159338_1512 [Sphingomonas sp. NFR04]